MRLKVHAGFPYPLRVCAASWRPWMNVSFHDNIAYIGGPMANILNIAAEHLNFTYDVSMPADGQWGIKMDGNSSWTGLVGMVQRNECDIIAPLASSYGRSTIVNYTAYAVMTYSSIMAGRMKGGSINIFGYFSIFSWQVWMTILLSIFVLSLLSVLTDFVSKLPNNYTWAKARAQFIRQLFEFLGTLLCESSPRPPNKTAARMALAAWWMTVIVLMNTFSGQLKASMFLSEEIGIINSIDDLADDISITPYTWKGSAYEAYVKEAENPSFKKVWHRIQKDGETLLMEPLFSFEMMRDVQRRKKSIIMDIPTMKYHITQNCRKLPDGELYLAKKDFYAHTLGLAVRPGLDKTFFREFNKRIRWLVESKLFDRWVDQLYGDFHRCLTISAFSDTKMLALNDLVPVFILWIFCLGLSTIAFFFEFFRYHLQKKREESLSPMVPTKNAFLKRKL